MTATLVIQGGKAVFSPGEGTWVLSGDLAGTAVHAEKAGPGFDHKPYHTTLDAKVGETSVTGTYATPSCTYAVNLASY